MNELSTKLMRYRIYFKDQMTADVDKEYGNQILEAMGDGKFSIPLTRIGGSRIRLIGDIKEIVDLDQKRKENSESVNFVDSWKKDKPSDPEEIKKAKERCRIISRVIKKYPYEWIGYKIHTGMTSERVEKIKRLAREEEKRIHKQIDEARSKEYKLHNITL